MASLSSERGLCDPESGNEGVERERNRTVEARPTSLRGVAEGVDDDGKGTVGWSVEVAVEMKSGRTDVWEETCSRHVEFEECVCYLEDCQSMLVILEKLTSQAVYFSNSANFSFAMLWKMS
jgi:hypothetical protein